MKNFNFKNYFLILFIFSLFFVSLFFSITPKIIKASELFSFNNFDFKFPPINVGSLLQRKSGPLVVDSFRSTSYSRFDSVFQIPEDAGVGKILTSNAGGDASWQPAPPTSVLWGSITGLLSNQSTLSGENGALTIRASIASPVFTNNPRSVTPILGDNDTSIATTAFVQNKKNDFTSNSLTWNDIGTLVMLYNMNDNISIGADSNILRGADSSANRFIHTNGTDSLYMGLGTGSNPSGSNNIGIGRNSFTHSNYGDNNTGLGYSVLGGDSFSDNVAIGYASRGSSSGDQNTAVGYSTLINASGNLNTAIGYGSLSQVTSGVGNVSLGALVSTLTLGSNNTGVGYGTNVSANNLTNATAIGYNASVSASNTMVFGNSSVTGRGFGVNPVFTWSGSGGPEERPFNSHYSGAINPINSCNNMGYRFYPTVNGVVNKLWVKAAGGTATLRLYRSSTQALLATATVTPAGLSTWVSVSITPVSVTANTDYIVAVATSGPCGNGSVTNPVSFPRSMGHITITASVFGDGSGTSFPSNTDPSGATSYGVADVSFVSNSGSSSLRVGTNSTNGNGALLTSAGVWVSVSDLNKKTNIQNLNYGLSEVLKLRSVSFNWKDSNTHDIGFIAQEVKEIIPELVYGTDGDLSLAYSQLPIVLTRALQDQNKGLTLDQKNFDDFETELNIIENKIKNAQ